MQGWYFWQIEHKKAVVNDLRLYLGRLELKQFENECLQAKNQTIWQMNNIL